jgi:hypothetical protein
MEKQRQFQVLLLPHSRIKPTSSLNQMSVEDEVRPASSGIHPTVNEKAKGGAHRGRWQHGRHFSHSSTISGYRFFLISNQLNHIIFGFFFCPGDAAAALPHWPDLEADRNPLLPGMDVDDLQSFVTFYRDHFEVHNQTKNDSHWRHFM